MLLGEWSGMTSRYCEGDREAYAGRVRGEVGMPALIS